MNGTYAALGNPGFGFLAMLVIGALAGWIAERVTKSDHGIFTNIVVGIAGSFVGTKLFEALGVTPVGGFFWTVLIAAVGAVLLLVLWRMIAGAARG